MSDFISREAAIKTHCSSCPYVERLLDEVGCKKDCSEYEAFELIPAADVRPVVRARWIEIDDYVLCPKCGTAEHSPNRNFCHTCGADMRPPT